MALGHVDGMSTDAPTLAPVNERWFKSQFALKRLSQRKLAEYLNLDPSAVTHTIRGKRRMQLDEAVKIARFLGVAVEQVLQNAGLRLGDDTAKVPLVGHVDERFEVHIGEQTRIIEVPARVPQGTVAVNMQTGMAAGGMVFFKPSDTIDPAAIGRLSIAEMENGPIILSNIGRGYAPGLYQLVTRDGIINDATLRSATPVLWLRP
jgi:transcriptional regulator with XRE-family HTH domain